MLASIPIRRAVHYMAWNALFRVPGLAWLIRRLRAFPVDIEAADAGATRTAVRLLNAGEVVMIFPEAGRSQDGRVQRFRPGAFRMACSLGVPVMPVTIIGGHECWPPGRRLPRPGRLTIVYHPVVAPPSDLDVKEAARELARRAHAVVASGLPEHQRAGRGPGRHRLSPAALYGRRARYLAPSPPRCILSHQWHAASHRPSSSSTAPT